MMPGGGVGVDEGGVVVQVNDGVESRAVEGHVPEIRLDQNQAKLEHLLFQAINPSNKVEDVNTIRSFCQTIDTVQDGAILAGRLLSHKIQSPMETEALYALATVEAAAKASDSFATEIAKFRFLNEMIKLVSSKHLGPRTAVTVKKRVIELLYSWTKSFPKEKKILEAYKTLKEQGIVKSDPEYVNDAVCPSSVQPREAEMNDDDRKTFEKFLHSGNPDDLIRANKMIQDMVKKGEEKLAKATRQASQLQEVEASCKLLSDMLDQIDVSDTSLEHRELMADLYKSCHKWRPKLFQLASEAEENDPSIGEILFCSDELSRIMERYKNVIMLNNPDRSRNLTNSTTNQVATISNQNQDLEAFFASSTTSSRINPSEIVDQDLGLSTTNTFLPIKDELASNRDQQGLLDLSMTVQRGRMINTNTTCISSGSSETNILDKVECCEESDRMLLGTIPPTSHHLISGLIAGDLDYGLNTGQGPCNETNSGGYQADLLSSDDVTICPGPSLMPPATTTQLFSRHLKSPQVKPRGLEMLDQIGEAALLQNLPENQSASFTARKQQNLSMNQLVANKETDLNVNMLENFNSILLIDKTSDKPRDETTPNDEHTKETCTIVNSTKELTVVNETVKQPVKLSEMVIKMSEIVPHPSLPPTWLTARDIDVALRLHPAQNCAAPGVYVFVLTLMNNSDSKVEEIDFKTALGKGIKSRICDPVKSLPEPSPFSPPPAGNQILLLQVGSGLHTHSHSNTINFSFVLSYMLNSEPITIIGKDIELEVMPT